MSEGQPETIGTGVAGELIRKPDLSLIMRPVPYPFYTALTVPNDGCSQTASDPWYINELLSRKYGLDFANSFHPHVTRLRPNTASTGSNTLFASNTDEAAHYPVQIGGETIDLFWLVLMYYYRGWMDHIHDWTDGSGYFVSIAKPDRLVVGATGETSKQLEVVLWGDMAGAANAAARLVHAFHLQLEFSEGITGVELEVRDMDNVRHYIVYKRPLLGRPGWDLSDLAPEELADAFMLMKDELNADAYFASSVSAGELRSVEISAFGGPDARLEFKGLRVCGLTRSGLEQQMRVMKRFNVLPIVHTGHGGHDNYWTRVVARGYPLTHEYPGGGTYSYFQRPWGQVPGSPCYIADLYKDFGLSFFNNTSSVVETLYAEDFLKTHVCDDDGSTFYTSLRTMQSADDDRYPSIHESTAGTLGETIARVVSRLDSFGRVDAVYTHYSYYSEHCFAPDTGRRYFTDVRRLPKNAEVVLESLSNMKFNLDGKRAPHQRIWCVPISVLTRFSQAASQLARHTKASSPNVVQITPWIDPVTGKRVPDEEFLTQDLHGHTFYVDDSKKARLFVDGTEILSLKRNRRDHAGRESVTIIDTNTPTVVFDERNLVESEESLETDGGQCTFVRNGGLNDELSLKITSDRLGDVSVNWNPRALDTNVTDYLRFRYRKTNPASRVRVEWTSSVGGRDVTYRATDGSLDGLQGWTIPHFEDTKPHEVVLDYADMEHPDAKLKQIPRNPVVEFRVTLTNANVGDALLLDFVEFLSARGVRPHCGQGLVAGGRLRNRADGWDVFLKTDNGTVRRETTKHGGWYVFAGVDPGTVVEIFARSPGEDNQYHYPPVQGRLLEIKRNWLEYDIDTSRGGRPVVR